MRWWTISLHWRIMGRIWFLSIRSIRILIIRVSIDYLLFAFTMKTSVGAVGTHTKTLLYAKNLVCASGDYFMHRRREYRFVWGQAVNLPEVRSCGPNWYNTNSGLFKLNLRAVLRPYCTVLLPEVRIKTSRTKSSLQINLKPLYSVRSTGDPRR